MRQKISCGMLEVACLLLSFGLVSASAQDMAQQVNGFTLEGFDETGERAWEVNGDTANIVGNTITISNVDANAYGEQDVNLKAKQGEIDKESGDVHLQQDVVITTADGSQLKTDSLHWEKATNEVTTPDPAQIIDKGMTATGIGLKANPELKTAQLEKNVAVEVEAESDVEGGVQEIVITCDGPMELDQLTHTATLRENVKAVRGEETLRADVVEVHFDPQTKKIVTIICTDNVSVQRGENISYADKAVYNAADQKVIFVGRPKLIMTTDEGGQAFF